MKRLPIVGRQAVSWRSCTSSLRIILLIRESSKMPPLHHRVRGYCHDSTPLLLSAPGLGTPVPVYHIALRLAQPGRGDAAETSNARKTIAYPLWSAKTSSRPSTLSALNLGVEAFRFPR